MTIALIAAAFLAGLAGSAHCAGMCGPIVGVFESTLQGSEQARQKRMAYHVGRLVFYATLGALSAAAVTTAVNLGAAGSVAGVLRWLAACALLLLGLRLLLGGRTAAAIDGAGRRLWRLLAPLARHVLPMTSVPRAVAGGFIWGALPCGLVYSAVAVAATSGSAIGGAVVMTAFWLGTLPALVLLGGTAAALWSGRRRRLAGAVTVAVALAALALPWLAGGSHEHHHEHNHDSHHHQQVACIDCAGSLTN